MPAPRFREDKLRGHDAKGNCPATQDATLNRAATSYGDILGLIAALPVLEVDAERDGFGAGHGVHPAAVGLC